MGDIKDRMVLILVLMAGIAPSVGASGDGSAMPLTVGNRWEYSVSEVGVMSVGVGELSQSMETQAEGTCVEEVISLQEHRPAGSVYLHRSTTNTEGGLNAQAGELTVDSLVLASKEGISILASKASGLEGMLSGEWVKYDPPLVMFGAGLAPGKTWKIGTVEEGGIHMPMEARVAGLETVTVPAGTFKDCLKIYVTCGRVSGTMGSGKTRATIKSGKAVSTVWVYPRVGTVREVSILQVKMKLPPDASGRSVLMTGTNRKTKELQPGYQVQAP